MDASGAAIVAGSSYSLDFPIAPGAYNTAGDGIAGAAFLTRLTPDGSELVYSTFVGSSGPVTGPVTEQMVMRLWRKRQGLHCCISVPRER